MSWKETLNEWKVVLFARAFIQTMDIKQLLSEMVWRNVFTYIGVKIQRIPGIDSGATSIISDFY